MKTKPDDHAFPADYGAAGLTKREYFAAMAMQGLIANSKETRGIMSTTDIAVQIADSLINRLNKVLNIAANIPEASNGLALGEEVPDEDAPPEHIFNESPELNDLETVFPKTKEFRHTDKYMREHNAKMNAKKLKNLPMKEINQDQMKPKKETKERKPTPKPEPKYFSDSTQEALYDGKEVALPGVQGTPKKFIVQNTYFQGRLDQAREQYNKYFNEIKVINKKLGEGNWLCTLTWESWLSTKYVANQPLERKIDAE